MKKITLNKDTRIKRSENYDLLKTIQTNISARIHDEFHNETTAIRTENDNFNNEEKEFFKNVSAFLKDIKTDTKLKIIVQVGPGSSVLHEYNGNIEEIPAPYKKQTYFNFISKDRDNDMRPFTVGFSCLQSIEILNS